MQRTALFTLPEATAPETTSAATWRARWVNARIGSYDDWNHLRVVALPGRLWIIAGTPAGGDWMMQHMDAIAGAVSDQIGAPVPVELRERAVCVRPSTDEIWGYRMPVVVVEKTAVAWAPHFAAEIAPDLRDHMARRFERSLRIELRAWGRLPAALDNEEPFLVVSSPGVAAGIPAITPDRSGHGKPVSVLVRRHLWLLANWRFEGDLFLGPLASLGYGRMIRCQPSEFFDRYTHKALLKLPSSAEELRS